MSTRPPWEDYAAVPAADSRPPWEDFAPRSPSASAPAEPPSFMDRLASGWEGAAPRRAGAVKSVLNTLTGVYDLGNMGPRDVAPGLFPQPQRNLTDLMLGREAQVPRQMTARELLQPDPSNPSAPTIVPTPEEEGGYTAGTVAQFLLPTPAGKGALVNAGLQAAQAGALTRLQGGSGSDAAAAAAFAGAGPLTAKLGEVAAPGLRRLAEAQYGRALNATTKGLKRESARIVPELLDRHVIGTLESLAEKGAEGSAKYGKKIGRAYAEASDAGVKSKTAPVLADLEKVKQRFFAKSDTGEAIPVNPAAIAKLEAMQELVAKFGDEARPDQLWAMRKNIDDIIEGSGGFSGPVTRGTANSLRRESRTAIQRELNNAHPRIEKLNAEFSLWKGLEDVAQATIDRKIGQAGIVEFVGRTTIGAGAGMLLGGGDSHWGTVGAALGAVTKHPLYRTVSAGEKARLAHALSQGQHATATSILSKILAGFSASDTSPASTRRP